MTGEILFRTAIRHDLPDIVRMLADDELGSQRERYEDPLPASYYTAFEEIDGNPNHQLVVAVSDGRVIGTLHLTFLPSISYQGGLRAQVESVRVDKECRNLGIGMRRWNGASSAPTSAAPNSCN